jgi:hypothetical protein
MKKYVSPFLTTYIKYSLCIEQVDTMSYDEIKSKVRENGGMIGKIASYVFNDKTLRSIIKKYITVHYYNGRINEIFFYSII